MKTPELSIDLKCCYIRVVRVMWRAKRLANPSLSLVGVCFSAYHH